MPDLDVERTDARMPPELGVHGRAIAGEEQPRAEPARRDQRTVHDGARRFVAAHGVNGYAHLSVLRVLKVDRVLKVHAA
jgi:hypothetical protein